MDEKIKLQDWLGYIDRLVSRLKSDQRQSGFTTWALLVVAGFFLYRIIDNIFYPEFIINFDLFTLSFISVANTFIVLMILISLTQHLQLINMQKETRILSRIDRATTKLITIMLLLILFFLIVLCLKAPSLKPSEDMKNWPYYMFAIFYFINFLIIIIIAIMKISTRLRKSSVIPEIGPVPMPNRKNCLSSFLITLLFFVILVMSVYTTWIQLFQYSTLRENPDIIKLSMEVCLLLVVLLILYGKLSLKVKLQFLANLEKQIVLGTLSTDQVRAKFVRNYLGETIGEWIKSKENELKRLFKDVEDSRNKAENSLKDLGRIDPQYSLEIAGRKDKICLQFYGAIDNYLSFLQDFLGQLDMLVKQNAFASDKDLLEQIKNEWKNQLSRVKALREDVCKQCKALGEDRSSS